MSVQIISIGLFAYTAPLFSFDGPFFGKTTVETAGVESLAPSQVATLTSHEHGIYLEFIDNNSILIERDLFVYKYILTPGKHKIGLSFYRVTRKSRSKQFIEFDAKAGHYYVVLANESGWFTWPKTWKAEIQDLGIRP